MNPRFQAVACLECGQVTDPDITLRACPACGGAWLDARYDLAGLDAVWPMSLADRPASLWRYGELLPFAAGLMPVTMGEGFTPLIRAGRLEAELGTGEIWVKDERQGPTGSFKDRQAACTVSALVAQGVTELVLASTGNAAAAYSAYCARAGIKLWVFLASSVPAEKMRELALYGAEVVKISGTYDQAKDVAADFARRRGLLLDGGAKAIPGKESMKTIAFEVAEQTDWQGVDWYVQAVSGGIGPLGVMKGFHELVAAGLLDHAPKLGLVQVAGCAPMVRAWERGLSEAEPVQPDTLITVLATGNPGLAYPLLKADVDAHGGAMVAASDGDGFRAMRRLARLEGLSVEPAVSVAFAGLEKLVAAGHIRPGERVVVNCSGHTFSAEKHALEDRYVLHMQTAVTGSGDRTPAEQLVSALEQLDEQVTTIVIIDDNPYDSRLIRRLLQGHKNYRIFEAHSGPDAIDLVRQRQPDLVVLDLMLPEVDGFAILDTLKADARTAQIPVVIVSAKSLSAEEAAHLEALSDSIWQKGSFSARELVSHVVEILGDELEVSEPTRLVASADPLGTFGQSDRPRILVVDANPLDARLMRRLFEARGRFEVVEVHSGAAAQAAVDGSVPDLVLLDLDLPDMSGQELLLWLRAHRSTRNVPTIVVAAGDLEPEEQNRVAPFAASVWSKSSMDRSSLLTAVETILTE